jgi:hypothetical protein
MAINKPITYLPNHQNRHSYPGKLLLKFPDLLSSFIIPKGWHDYRNGCLNQSTEPRKGDIIDNITPSGFLSFSPYYLFYNNAIPSGLAKF